MIHLAYWYKCENLSVFEISWSCTFHVICQFSFILGTSHDRYLIATVNEVLPKQRAWYSPWQQEEKGIIHYWFLVSAARNLLLVLWHLEANSISNIDSQTLCHQGSIISGCSKAVWWKTELLESYFQSFNPALDPCMNFVHRALVIL